MSARTANRFEAELKPRGRRLPGHEMPAVDDLRPTFSAWAASQQPLREYSRMSSSRTPSRGGKSDHSSSSTKVTSTAVESSSSSRKGGTMPKPMSPRLFRRKLLNSLPNFLPVLVYSSHVLLALHTKVEESFTLHAAHDVLAHGISPSSLSKVSDVPRHGQAD